MSDPTLLELANLRAGYRGEDVLCGVSLDVRPGEFVGVLGRNGAGKTTLLHAILGLLPLKSGSVQLGGRDLRELSRGEIAKRAAWVPQRAALGESFTVRELVAMGRYAYRSPFAAEGERDRSAIHTALRETDLLELAERRATELSGGEIQRMLFARALAQEASLLVLDEPIANLDLSHQIDALERIREICRERGALATFHDLTLAGRYCDRLCVLHEGKIALDDRPEAVLNSEVLARYFSVEARVERDAAGAPLVSVLRALHGAGEEQK